MTWRESAACAGVDPEMFFPGTGGNRHMDTYAEARRVCARCPVTLQCLEDALAHEEWGMRGGLTPDEQHQLRKDRQRVKADLGKATECVQCDRRLIPRPGPGSAGATARRSRPTPRPGSAFPRPWRRSASARPARSAAC